MNVIFYANDLGLIDIIEKDKAGMFPNTTKHTYVNKVSISQVYLNFLRDLAEMDSLAAIVTTIAETDERLRDLLTQAQSPETSFGLDDMYSDLFMPVITKPTRITEKSATLIDNIYSDNVDADSFQGIFYTGITDHLPVFMILKDVNDY